MSELDLVNGIWLRVLNCKVVGDSIIIFHNEGILYKLEHVDVTYYKDAAIKFLKDRGTTFEELVGES